MGRGGIFQTLDSELTSGQILDNRTQVKQVSATHQMHQRNNNLSVPCFVWISSSTELEPYLELFSRSYKIFDDILGRINFYKLNRFEMPELLSLWKLIRWKRSCKFGLNYCSCRNRNARKDLVSLARIIVLVEMAKHAVCLPICPSQPQHFPLRTNKQRNGAAGRLALFKYLPLEKYTVL